MIDGNYHLVKYSWLHAFSAIIWCEKCAHNFKVGEVIYKHPKKIDGIVMNYYFCLKCARKMGFKGVDK